MNYIVSKLDWLMAARRFRTFIPSLIVFVALTMLLIRGPFALSSSTAQAVSGGAIWSTIVLIIGPRAGNKFLRLEDYVDLHYIGTFMLVNSGASLVVVFASEMKDQVWFVLMMLSTLPCLALATIARHALFSQEEWKAAARNVR